MKTLKKTLCLVLAVVMAVGVLILPANAAFTDEADITKDYKTAVTALVNYGILQGKKNGDELKIDPLGDVTRAEVATMAYRMLTGDVAGTNVGNYVNYAGVFSDVTADWQRGPVGFAANGKLVVGIGGDKYAPNANVTGYELLAIMLRALGYGQLGEFTGAKWKENTYAQAVKSGLDEKVKNIDLSLPLSREKVAQIMYNTIYTPRVVYTPGYGYTYVHTDGLNTEANFNDSLIEVGKAKNNDRDKFGAPTGVTTPYQFTWPVTNIDASWVRPINYVARYFEAVTECKVSEDAADGTYTTYTNGPSNVATETIESTDEIQTIGAQGRETDVYVYTNAAGASVKEIVYKDTVLAVVTKTTPELKDTVGHVIQKAKSYVTVYGNNIMQGLYGCNFKFSPKVAILNNIEIEGTYPVGTYLSANILTTAPATATGKPEDYNKFDSKIKLVNIVPAATAEVTISGIQYNGLAGANTKAIGFEGTDGNTYRYAVTFGYNKTDAAPIVNGSDVKTLGNTSLGLTYTVFVTPDRDSAGNYNVIGIAPQGVTANVGVIVKAEKVNVGNDSFGNALFAQELTILKEDNTTVTIRYIGINGTSANTTGTYNTPVNTIKGSLVSFSINPNNTKYYNVYPSTPTKNTKPVVAGKADTIDSILVNDDTVFFVETYKLNLAKKGYYTDSYAIYKGFKNIPNMIDGVDIWDSDNDKIVPHNSMEFNYVLNPDTHYASYVLIKYGTESSTSTPKSTNQYAYIDYQRYQTSIHEGDYTFNALVDGVSTNIIVKSLDGQRIFDLGNGLYIYGEYTNGAVGKISGPVNHIKGTSTWSHVAGVIDLGTDPIMPDGVGPAKQYYTVVDNCPIHIVNPTTGAVVQTLYDLDVIELTEMYQGAELYFELNEYGWIDRIYVVNDMKGTNGGDVTDPAPSTYNVLFRTDIVNKLGYKLTQFYLNNVQTSPAVVAGGYQYSNLAAAAEIKIDGLYAYIGQKIFVVINDAAQIYSTVDPTGVISFKVSDLVNAAGVGNGTFVITNITNVTSTTVKVVYPAYKDAAGKDVASETITLYPYVDGKDDVITYTVKSGFEVASITSTPGAVWSDPTDYTFKDGKLTIKTASGNLKGYSEIVVTLKETEKPNESIYNVTMIANGVTIGTATVKHGAGKKGSTDESVELVALNTDNQDKVIAKVTEIKVGNSSNLATSLMGWDKVIVPSADGKSLILNPLANDGIIADVVITVELANEAEAEDYTEASDGTNGSAGAAKPLTGGPSGIWDTTDPYKNAGLVITADAPNKTINVKIYRDTFKNADKKWLAQLQKNNAGKETYNTENGFVGITFTVKTDKIIKDVKNPDGTTFANSTEEDTYDSWFTYNIQIAKWNTSQNKLVLDESVDGYIGILSYYVYDAASGKVTEGATGTMLTWTINIDIVDGEIA